MGSALISRGWVLVRDVKEVHINGVLRSINVMGLKPHSRKIIVEKLIEGIYPVVTDLYRNNNLNLATGKRNVKYFSVRTSLLLNG
jgi:hypothetical protein